MEFASAVWEKVRTQEITAQKAYAIHSEFQKDFGEYNFVEVTKAILTGAENRLLKYRTEGLRTLDSIQLATYVALKAEVDVFLTSDNLLKTLLQKEGLPADLPES